MPQGILRADPRQPYSQGEYMKLELKRSVVLPMTAGSLSSRWQRVLREEQAEFGELGAQGGGRREMNRVDAERASSLRIRGDVVDINSALRINRKPLEQQFENAGV